MSSSVAPAGRNDPCPCGSGKKYKKCHLEADALTGKLHEDARARPRVFLHGDHLIARMLRQNDRIVTQQGRMQYLAAEHKFRPRTKVEYRVLNYEIDK